MRVRFTTTQFDRCIQLASTTSHHWGPAIIDWFNTETQAASRRRVDCVMPVIGWTRMQELLFDTAFTPKGFVSKDTPLHIINALRQVTASINHASVHPALKNIGMVGLHNEILPVWPSNNEWTLLPNDQPMQLLIPRYETSGGHRLTYWKPGHLPAAASRLLQETEHIRFT
jgi:hypothetical protein